MLFFHEERLATYQKVDVGDSLELLEEILADEIVRGVLGGLDEIVFVE